MLSDKNIQNYKEIITPKQILESFPLTKKNKEFIEKSREEIEQILNSASNKKIIISGPCSVHNPAELVDYAKEIKKIQEEVQDKILIILRVYFEKPRSTIGWKGLIFDPDLDDSFNMNKGLKTARELLTKITDLEIPIATEFLDPFTPQYISDYISWAAIGARTIESQTHRQMTSGLSMPVGLKNATNGSIDIAIDAIISASSPHSFIGINKEGKVAQINTKGNKNCHLVLRGGKNPNYDKESIQDTNQKLIQRNIAPKLIIDCSHANSNKDHNKQEDVLKDIISQMKTTPEIKGLMLESNINEGNQKISDSLKYGISITDKCINLEKTEELINFAFNELP